MFSALLSPWTAYGGKNDHWGAGDEDINRTGYGMGAFNPSPALLPNGPPWNPDDIWNMHMRNIGGDT